MNKSCFGKLYRTADRTVNFVQPSIVKKGINLCWLTRRIIAQIIADGSLQNDNDLDDCIDEGWPKMRIPNMYGVLPIHANAMSSVRSLE